MEEPASSAGSSVATTRWLCQCTASVVARLELSIAHHLLSWPRMLARSPCGPQPGFRRPAHDTQFHLRELCAEGRTPCGILVHRRQVGEGAIQDRVLIRGRSLRHADHDVRLNAIRGHAVVVPREPARDGDPNPAAVGQLIPDLDRVLAESRLPDERRPIGFLQRGSHNLRG